MGIQDQFKDKEQRLAGQAKQAQRGGKPAPQQQPSRGRPQQGRPESPQRGSQSRDQRRERMQDEMHEGEDRMDRGYDA
ncbi:MULTISPECIES: hypothetical protein [unclassified Streptomyces]|uniref:hypothetical protein n=1 Tax=unclassified Streptomyces TaxID=2593676 RepID=UPI003647FE97